MTHPDEGAFLRFLDMETSRQEFDEMQEHLGRCPACIDRLGDIRDTMSFVAAALSRTDLLARKRKSGTLPRFFAAAATIVLAAAVYFTPLRAWVTDRARELWSVRDDTEVPVDAAQRSVVEFPPSRGIVSFFPTNDVFVLEVTSRQETGSLNVSIGAGEMATATISGDLTDESLFVLPGRLRIVNTTESTTMYTVVLPPGVGRIEVVVAGEVALVLRPSDAQRSWTMPVAVR
jgi:hypothetical protein